MKTVIQITLEIPGGLEAISLHHVPAAAENLAIELGNGDRSQIAAIVDINVISDAGETVATKKFGSDAWAGPLAPNHGG